MSILTRPRSDGAPRAGAPAAARRGSDVEFAVAPRAHLLPPEVGQLRRRAALRRRMFSGLVLVAVLAAGGVVAAWAYAQSEAAQLTNVQSQQQVLNLQLAKLAPVKTTADQIAAKTDAEAVGGYSDVDWAAFISQLQGTLPAGVSLATVSVTAANPMQEFQQPTMAASKPRVAMIVFSATSSTLPLVPQWIAGLTGLPGYIQAQPGAITFDDASKKYTASVTLDLSAGVLSHKYLPEVKK